MWEWVELSSKGIQGLAVVVVVVSIVFGTLRFLRQAWKPVPDPYRAYKQLLGRAVLLSLEFLVAADVLRTVLLDLTAKGMEILGALVLIRTFLSLSLVVELEGRWPWRAAETSVSRGKARSSESETGVYATAGDIDYSAANFLRGSQT